ncbi:unnamed protein product, partial [Didymodactylos carnosus]
WFGFATNIAGIIGGLLMSTVGDLKSFQRSLKLLAVLSLICCFICCLWFQLCVRTMFYEQPILKSSVTTIGISLALTGLFQGATTPLIYECLAELMFPLPESVSASILVQWINVVALVLLFVAPGRYKLMNLLVLCMIFLAIIMILFVKVKYTRKDEDERKKSEKQALEQITTNTFNTSIINNQQQNYGTIPSTAQTNFINS